MEILRRGRVSWGYDCLTRVMKDFEVDTINEEFIWEISGLRKELEKFVSTDDRFMFPLSKLRPSQRTAQRVMMTTSWYIQDVTRLRPDLKRSEAPPDPCGVMNRLVAIFTDMAELSRMMQLLEDRKVEKHTYLREAEEIERLASGLNKSIGGFLEPPLFEQWDIEQEYERIECNKIWNKTKVLCKDLFEAEYQDDSETESENGSEAEFGDKHEDEFRFASSKFEDMTEEAEGDDEEEVEKLTGVQDALISPLQIGIQQEEVESSTSVECKKRKQCESAADVHDENSMRVRSLSHEHGVEVGKEKAGRENELNSTCISLDKSGDANKDKPGSEGRRNVGQLLLVDRFRPFLVLRQLFADLKSHEILGRIDRNLMEGVLRYYAKDFPEGICTSFWREISILLTLNEEGAEEKVGKFEEGAEGKVYKFDSKHWKRHNYLKLSDDARAHRSKILNEKSAGRKLAKLRHFAENYSSWGIRYYKYAEFYWHANQKCHPIIEELGEEVCSLGTRGAYVFDGFDLWGVVETLVFISDDTFDTTEPSSLSPMPYTPLTD